MTIKNAIFVAAAFAILHLLLSGWYAAVTPYRTGGILLGQRDPKTGQFQSVPDVGAPDERQHANYVLHLLDGKGFPVLDPKDPNLGDNYQSHQPPLFYVLEAGWSKLIVGDLTNSSDGFKLRLLNGLIGMLTVIGTFFIGRWGFKRDDLGIMAAAFVALLPMNCALSGALSNDPLLFCLCTWTIALLARGCVEGWTMKLAVGVGLLVGFAILTKTTAIALLPVLLLSLFLGANKPQVKHVAVCALALLVVAAPWLARNQSLYGDPLAVSAFNEAFKGSPSRELITDIAQVQNQGKDPNLAYWTDWVGWWTVRSFFGVFGYMDIFLNEKGVPSTGPANPNALYRMLLALGVVALALWALALRRPEWKEHKRMHWLLGSFLLIVVVLFLRFNAQYFQGQARYLFPAIGGIGIGVGIASLQLARSNWRAGLAIVAGVLLLLNIYALARLPGEFSKRNTTFGVRQTTPRGSLVSLSNERDIGRV
jgi:4-amino-4-deoxy-L-arabinose transferase-like glycosyltransferase